MLTPHSRAGFTFWEVAAVFALVLIIAAVLLPVFQKRPENDRLRGGCQSNLKQLGLAYEQYMQDNDEICPAGVNAAGNGWAGAVYPFVKATGVYHCPYDTATGSHISYAENQNLVGQPLRAFADPAATVALYETTTLNCDPSTSETVSATGLSAPQNSDRHDADTFALWFLAADGHVKWLTPLSVSSGPGALPTRKITQSHNGPAILTFAIK